MAHGKAHTEETKAAVLAALLEGQSLSQVARDWRLPKSTVARWKAECSGTVGPEKQAEIGELLLGYLRENITTLRAQAEKFRDSQWLDKQPAAEVAVLHGVLADKAVRLLEALEPAEGPGGAEISAP